MGRGLREKFSSSKLKDFVTHAVASESPSCSPPSSSASSGTPYPIAHYINCTKFSPNYLKFVAAVVSTTEPKSFKEAMRSDGWKASMQAEIQALEDNGTWTLEELPPGKRALGSQWVYRILQICAKVSPMRDLLNDISDYS